MGSSTISIRALERLGGYLKIPAAPSLIVYSKHSATAFLDGVIVERFRIDTQPARLGKPDAAAEREIDTNTFVDEWGVTRRRVAGEHFIRVDGPFGYPDGPTPRDLHGFSWPDPDDPG
jgi:hypothetical protein